MGACSFFIEGQHVAALAACLNGSDYMACRIANCTKVVVAQAGHGVNVEQPVNAALRDFLQRL